MAINDKVSNEFNSAENVAVWASKVLERADVNGFIHTITDEGYGKFGLVFTLSDEVWVFTVEKQKTDWGY